MLIKVKDQTSKLIKAVVADSMISLLEKGS